MRWQNNRLVTSHSPRLGRSACAFLLTLGLSSQAWAATDEERAGARAAANSGVEACNAEQWKECADRFERAESIIHSPVHLLYIGRARMNLGQLVEAREAYLRISREGAPAGASETIQNTVAEAEKELETLEPRLAQATVHVTGGGDQKVTLFMDGREVSSALIGIPRPVNPGKHEFRASAPGMTSAPVSIEVSEGGKKEISIALEVDPNAPKEAPPANGMVDGGVSSSGFKWNGLTIGGLAAAGVGVGGAVVGTIFMLDSKSQADRVTALCGGDPNRCAVDDPSPEADQVNAANNQAGDSQLIGIIGLGAGAAGLITGAVLIYLGQQQEDAPPAKSGELHIKPVFGFQSVGLTGTF